MRLPESDWRGVFVLYYSDDVVCKSNKEGMKVVKSVGIRERAIMVFSLACLLVILSCFAAAAQVKFVTVSGSGARNGDSWNNAYGAAEFRSALSTLVETTYWLAEGEYSPGDKEDESFVPAFKAVILGGFKGNEASADDRDPENNVTTLTGRIDGTKNNRTVVWIGKSSYATLDGLRVTDGKGGQQGGGIVLDETSTVVLNSCVISGNESKIGGGVCIGRGAVLTAENCIFADNHAVGTSAWGGAVFVDGAFWATNCSFEKNTSSWPGGAIHSTNWGTLALKKSTFFKNRSTSSSGGAVSAYGGELVAVNCTFVENTASYYGGGALLLGADPGAAALRNCTFYNNTKNQGEGETVRNYFDVFEAVNCIFWGDSSEKQIDSESTVEPILSHCVIKGGYSTTSATVTNIITDDPRLDDSLKLNGGLTKNLALLEGSSAIDTGTANGAPSEDQRGVTRPKGAAYDIGAYEYDPGATPGGGGGCNTVSGAGLASVLMAAPLLLLFRKPR